MRIINLRTEFHSNICNNIVRVKRDVDNIYPNFADKWSESSQKISWGLFNKLGCIENYENINSKTAYYDFIKITREFLDKCFPLLQHLRPGRWHCFIEQNNIAKLIKNKSLCWFSKNKEHYIPLLSNNKEYYFAKPDIIIVRHPFTDDEFNQYGKIFNGTDHISKLASLLEGYYNENNCIIHASISCIWTLLDDRSQNIRTELLGLIRNQKGPLPHIIAVTAEPLPTRIASLALGTADLDCVYHFALNELREAIEGINNNDQLDMLNMMIEGRRLRDISDLPFDLAI